MRSGAIFVDGINKDAQPVREGLRAAEAVGRVCVELSGSSPFTSAGLNVADAEVGL